MRSAAALLLFLPAVALAQVRESVTVEVIEVPVHVTAADGQPLRGLSRDAFELRVNRRVVPIEYFDAVDLPAPAADAAQTAESVRVPARERRLYLLLFDTLYSNPGKLLRAQQAAEMAVARANPSTDLFAVATYSANKGVQFVTPFVSDRTATLRAVRTLTISRTDPFGLAMSATERTNWLAPTSEGNQDYAEMGGTKHGSEASATMAGGATFQNLLRDQPRHPIEDLLGNLADLAKRLRGLDGQKHLLYFSSGFPLSLMSGGGSPASSPVRYADSPLSALSSAGGAPDAHSLNIFHDMARDFAAAGVVIDTIDIDGVRISGQTSSDTMDSLRMVAQATGGDFVHNRNDLRQALSELTAAQRAVYILGFNRRGRRGGTISVHVNGVPSGTRLSYRPAFGAAETRKDIDPLQLIDILVNDIPQHDITTRLTVTNSTALLELRPAELPEDAKSIEALLYVFNSEGLAIAGYQKRIVLAKRTPIVIRQSLNFPPGRYVLKAVVQVAGSASTGFARTELTVR